MGIEPTWWVMKAAEEMEAQKNLFIKGEVETAREEKAKVRALCLEWERILLAG